MKCTTNSKYTSDLRNNSCDISFKKSAARQPAKRPTGIISSRFMDNVYTTSDTKLKTKNKTRDHFTASCARLNNLSRSICSAFFQGNSWTKTGIFSLSFSLMIPIFTLTSLGSLWWSAIDTLNDLVRVYLLRRGRYISEHLRNWQGWHWDSFTYSKEGKLITTNERKFQPLMLYQS